MGQEPTQPVNGPSRATRRASRGKAPKISKAVAEVIQAGLAAQRQGELDEAMRAYRAVLDTDPRNPDALHLLGTVHGQKGELPEAERLIRKAIAAAPGMPQFHSNLGGILRARGDAAAAEAEYRRAIELKPENAEAFTGLGQLLREQGRGSEAIENLAAAVELSPEAVGVHRRLGRLYREHEQYTEAEASFRVCLEASPDDPEVINELGYCLFHLARYEEAAELLGEAHSRGMRNADLCNNLASALGQLARLDEAEAALKEALELKPGDSVYLNNLGGVYMQNGRLEEAMRAFDAAHTAEPDDVDKAVDLAACLVAMGRTHRAIEMLTALSERAPDHAGVWNELGNAHMQQNRKVEALAAFEKGLEADPNDLPTLMNYCITLRQIRNLDGANIYAHIITCHPKYTPQSFVVPYKAFRASCDFAGMAEVVDDIWTGAEQMRPSDASGMVFELLVEADTPENVRKLVRIHRRWGAAYEAMAQDDPLPAPVIKKHKTLRVGFMSSDLRTHAVGKHVLPVLRNYDPERIEIHAYTPWVTEGDPVHDYMTGLFCGHRVTEGLSLREIAQTVRADDIDVLFDLNGHTFGGKAPAMAYKPAPLQMSWLGYPFTIGLSTIDYFLLDERLKPTEEGVMHEKPLVMPKSYICFEGYDPVPITDTPPFAREGRITFGTLNNVYKFTQRTLELWAEVMRGVPDSRMLFVRSEFHSAKVCQNVARTFEAFGVDPERLFFVDNHKEGVPHLNCYNEIDISLDTFPLVGGTTTCDAMWMGVPVVTKVGAGIHSRLGYSLLGSAGLEELCTWSDEEFVERAVGLAHDEESIAFLRQNLRPAVLDSVLFDGAEFTEAFTDTIVGAAKAHGIIG